MAKRITKDWEKYIGLLVAIDDRNRLIAYGKKRLDVLEEVHKCFLHDDTAKCRIYKVYAPFEKGLIMGLLDYII